MLHFVCGKIIQWMGTRADKAHFTLQHVPKLGKLVETVAPQKTSDPRDPRIVCNLEEGTRSLVMVSQCNLQLIRIVHHGAKLKAMEWSAFPPCTQRDIHHQAFRVEFDEDGNEREERCKNNKGESGPHHVNKALQEQGFGRRVLLMQANDRQVADPFHFAGRNPASEQIWHHLDI